MYSPDEQGEYIPEVGTACFSVQGLTNMLTTIEKEVTEVQLLSTEFAMQLEVTMADCPGCPCPPAFSWNAGMVMHVLKSDPMLRDLGHVQVDGPRMAYLFFYNKQGLSGLSHETARAIQTHVLETFAEWISCSAHFAVNPLPLAEGWHHMVTPMKW